jgi:hypothetical protein
MAAGREVSLTVRLENSRPVELIDLAISLEALGQEYRTFVHRSGHDDIAGNATLYIEEIRSGSIVVQLKALLEQASFVVDHLDVLAGFVTNIQDLVDFFLGRPGLKQPPVPRDEAERLSTMLQPVAKDVGGQLTINVTGNYGPITINPVFINSERANAVQNGIRRYLDPSIPAQGRFERELLYLDQFAEIDVRK